MFQIGNGTDSNGQAKCDLAPNPRDRIKNILGIQEKIKYENISNRSTEI